MMNTYYLLTLLGRAAGHGATLVTIQFFQAGSRAGAVHLSYGNGEQGIPEKTRISAFILAAKAHSLGISRLGQCTSQY